MGYCKLCADFLFPSLHLFQYFFIECESFSVSLAATLHFSIAHHSHFYCGFDTIVRLKVCRHEVLEQCQRNVVSGTEKTTMGQRKG